MGHRHLFSTSQMFENDHGQNQNQNHMNVQPYMHSARATTAENGPLVFPVESMSIDGVHFSSHWNPVARSSFYSASFCNAEVPQYRPDVPGPSHDLSLHPSVAGSFCITPENYYAHHASSSSYGRQTFHGTNVGSVDQAIASGRGPYKRKSPGIPEEGSTSRIYGGGSSSNLSMHSHSQQDKPNTDCQHAFWDMAPGCRVNAISFGCEGSLRNVRIRSANGLESNLAGTHLSSNLLPHPYSASHPIDYPNSVDQSSQNSIALGESNQLHVPPTQWGPPVSEAIDVHRGTNAFLVGSNIGNASVDIGGYHHDFISTRDHFQQNLHGTSSRCVGGVRSSYSQWSTPSFRASSSNLRMEQFGMSDDGLHLITENLASGPSRPPHVVGWHSGERNGRLMYRSFSDATGVRDQLASSEALMFVDHTAFYGSRNLLDQHWEMRLDVENMSYEELLALGERIGNVSTGLSEDVMSKCLIEARYQSPDKGRCVICLEEYNNMDKVGALKICGHDYHVGCIGKWLSMKNICPICKTSVVADNMKEK